MSDAAPPPDRDADAGEAQSAPAATAGLLQVIGAVLWSFFGVRKGRAMRRDVVAIKPHQVVLVGIALAALLVVTLLVLVHLIVANAT
ncbi:MAG TPA: DUF2970 domain-containing protein [Casimicrobiaceae bacterium]|jgi:hypothetical protein